MNGIGEFWEGAGLDIRNDGGEVEGEVKGEFVRRRAGLANLAELAGAMQKNRRLKSVAPDRRCGPGSPKARDRGHTVSVNPV